MTVKGCRKDIREVGQLSERGKTAFILFQAILSVCVALSAAYPYPQSNEFAQERDGAPSYGKQPDGYFQYVNVPAHKEYEFGWNRGNPHHYISRYEQGKDHRFRTRVSRLLQCYVYHQI